MKKFLLLVCVLALIAMGVRNGQSSTSSAGQKTYTVASWQHPVNTSPTISATFIDQVLAAAHSPAQGTGQVMYDLGLRYGIDPAYALAFFHIESSYGTTGIARFTHSLGNIRCSAGYACRSDFRSYPSWEAGYEDWYHLVRTLYIGQWHLTTVEQIVPVYAPASENDVRAYIASVEQDVATWRGESR